jgi:hypothetical protein
MSAIDDVRKFSRALLEFHKMLIDAARDEYVREHGIALSPAALLELLMGDSSFAWLQPMTQAIVAIDEAVAGREPEAIQAAVEKAAELIASSADDPDSVTAHATSYAAENASIGTAQAKVRAAMEAATFRIEKL